MNLRTDSNLRDLNQRINETAVTSADYLQNATSSYYKRLSHFPTTNDDYYFECSL